MIDIHMFMLTLLHEQMSMRELARVAGYGTNHMRLRGLYQAKATAENVTDLAKDDAVQGIFKPRKDKIAGDPIWAQAWHNFMDLKKGQSFRCQIVKTERVKDTVSGKWLWKTEWARHQKRYMSMKIAEFHAAILKWEPYLKWREQYLELNPKVSRDWHVGIKRLYKERCFCIDAEEAIRKCGCEYHLKMSELIAALKRWRRAVRPKIQAKAIESGETEHSCQVCATGETYFDVCNNVSTFGDHVCPCGKDATSQQRKLICGAGTCETCKSMLSHLTQCEGEADFKDLAVKYKWLRPIKIGNRMETEWAYHTKPYSEFVPYMTAYFENVYRLHNWVYKRQDDARRQCRKRLQPGEVILEFDYAAKASQFMQDGMPCSATRQTSQ